MTNPLSEDYLRWLAPQIRDEQYSRGKQYWGLLSIMYEKAFDPDRVWLVSNDDNRLADGLDLRDEFCYENHIHMGSLRGLGPCSFLEVLIGLSRRLSFNSGGTVNGWAWQLLVNLELEKMSDPISRHKIRKTDRILDTVIQRTYQPDGVGGFFPLAWPDEDQTKKEIWYQMAAYLDELHPVQN